MIKWFCLSFAETFPPPVSPMLLTQIVSEAWCVSGLEAQIYDISALFERRPT